MTMSTTNQEHWIKTTCPRDCYDGCGIIVQKRNGKIIKVKGNRDHPSTRGPLCPKCAVSYNGAWLDENARLLYPLKRSGKKGSGNFERISWDEALAEIADRFGDISRDHSANQNLSYPLHRNMFRDCWAISKTIFRPYWCDRG